MTIFFSLFLFLAPLDEYTKASVKSSPSNHSSNHRLAKIVIHKSYDQSATLVDFPSEISFPFIRSFFAYFLLDFACMYNDAQFDMDRSLHPDIFLHLGLQWLNHPLEFPCEQGELSSPSLYLTKLFMSRFPNGRRCLHSHGLCVDFTRKLVLCLKFLI